MKPVKLIMNAFGPYASGTEIDFEQFGGQGLYLITGDTGSKNCNSRSYWSRKDDDI